MGGSLKDSISERGITEVVHFTHGEAGLTGILRVGAVQSRKKLQDDDRLKYIFQPNANYRKDKNWIDYVNLSISDINAPFFFVSSERWHNNTNDWWVILSFNPDILLHEGVYFSTTNNFYSSVRRGRGVEGFEALFGEIVHQYPGSIVHRSPHLGDNQPTCQQAEVLYPGEVILYYLEKIYVREGEDFDDVRGKLSLFGFGEIEVEQNFEKFKGRNNE